MEIISLQNVVSDCSEVKKVSVVKHCVFLLNTIDDNKKAVEVRLINFIEICKK